MPIYQFSCTSETCENEQEEIQRYDDPAPACSKCESKTERVMTSASHRFAADYSSDGLGGFERQGDAMVRVVTGANTTRYGTDSRGRN